MATLAERMAALGGEEDDPKTKKPAPGTPVVTGGPITGVGIPKSEIDRLANAPDLKTRINARQMLPLQPAGSVTAGTASPKAGWVKGQRVSYFDVGPVSGQRGKMWRFATGKDAQGVPIPFPRQLTVADPSSTSFRQVWLVMVAAGYVANRITTAKQLQESGFKTEDLNLVVNVPLPPSPPEPAGPTTSSFAVIGVFALAFLISAAYLLRKSKRPAAPASVESAAVAG